MTVSRTSGICAGNASSAPAAAASVGDKVKQEDIHAKFEDGILRLFVPKVSPVVQAEQKNLIAIEG